MSPQRLLRLLVESLRAGDCKVVFAESCTAGLVAATLGKQPGISKYLCGSAVTYREDTKQQWLGVRTATLRKYTAVSSQAAIEMARGVLRITPEAQWGVSVTGHLGPDAPPELDGVVYVAIARRRGNSCKLVCCECYHLSEQTRLRRRAEAVDIVLDLLVEALAEST